MRILRGRLATLNALGTHTVIKPWELRWADLGCSDKKDSIHALLALMPASPRGRIVPDYALPIAKLFDQVIDTY